MQPNKDEKYSQLDNILHHRRHLGSTGLTACAEGRTLEEGHGSRAFSRERKKREVRQIFSCSNLETTVSYNVSQFS